MATICTQSGAPKWKARDFAYIFSKPPKYKCWSKQNKQIINIPNICVHHLMVSYGHMANADLISYRETHVSFIIVQGEISA